MAGQGRTVRHRSGTRRADAGRPVHQRGVLQLGLRPSCKTRLRGVTRRRHERPACPQRPLGSHRTAAAERAAEAQERPPRGPDRAALAGIVFVLRTGYPCRLLPTELGRGSGTACRRRLRDRQQAGVWERLHERLLNWLGDEAAVDWSRASADSRCVGAKRGQSDPNPTDRGKPGSKHHPIVGRNGIPPTVRFSATNAHDATQLLPWTTPPPRSSARGVCRAGPGGARPSRTPIRRTTPRRSAAPCVLGASPSPIGGSTPASGWGGTAGSSSGRCPGYSADAASAAARSAGRTDSRACCPWPARWPASGSSTRGPADGHEVSAAPAAPGRTLSR